MAAAKKTTTHQTYTITGRIRADVLVEIQSPSWEEATAQARTLKLEDFVTPCGDISDCNDPEIRTIWLNE